MLEALEKKLGLPPLRELTPLVTGSSGKRLERLLGKLEGLSRNGGESIGQAIELLKIVRDLDQSGGLERLENILSLLPKGKQSQELLEALNDIIAKYGPKIEKLVDFLEAMAKEA